MASGIALKRFNPAALILLAALVLGLFGFESQKPQENSKDIVDKMFSAINGVKTLTYTLRTRERMEGKLAFVEQDVKFGKSPLRVYVRMKAPKKHEGVELLYKEGANDNKVYVNTNKFPYVTISLDPTGNLLRRSNQHTIKEVGFDYIARILKHIASKHPAEFGKLFLFSGHAVFDNRPCYKIVVDYPQFKYIPYTMGPNESVTDIADKLLVSDYMILQLNPQLKGYDDIKPGLKIKVPNAYARRTELLIDKATYLPISQSMYDDKGLYAQYNFHALRLNPTLSDQEFSDDYPQYRFRNR